MVSWHAMFICSRREARASILTDSLSLIHGYLRENCSSVFSIPEFSPHTTPAILIIDFLLRLWILLFFRSLFLSFNRFGYQRGFSHKKRVLSKSRVLRHASD